MENWRLIVNHCCFSSFVNVHSMYQFGERERERERGKKPGFQTGYFVFYINSNVINYVQQQSIVCVIYGQIIVKDTVSRDGSHFVIYPITK